MAPVMPDSPTSNVIGVRDVYDLVAGIDAKIETRFSALESKVDTRLDKTDDKVDHLSSRIDRFDGAISVVKWLGPAGVVGIIYGLGKSAGYW